MPSCRSTACCSRHPRANGCSSGGGGSSSSRSSSSSSSTAPPSGSGPVLVTFEDRGFPRVLQKKAAPLPSWVHRVVNLAAGQQRAYRGWFTKPRVLHAWLLAHAATLGNRLVVFIDGSDVVWGGCASFEDELAHLQARHASEAASAPTIIFSAELGCDFHVPTPPGCAGIAAPPRWAASAPLGASLAHWHNCAVEGAAPCVDPPSCEQPLPLEPRASLARTHANSEHTRAALHCVPPPILHRQTASSTLVALSAKLRPCGLCCKLS